MCPLVAQLHDLAGKARAVLGERRIRRGAHQGTDSDTQGLQRG